MNDQQNASAGQVPVLPSYMELGNLTWVQLREAMWLAMTALSHLTTGEDTELARTTLITMNRILSPGWDGQGILSPDWDGQIIKPAADPR